MSRVTLRERFFPLHQPADVERFLGGFPWCVIFKAGTSDKTFDAWLVAQQVLEPRVDVAVGFIRLPEDRPASERVATLFGIVHRSPQLILFHEATARGHLDESAIVPDQLVPLLSEQLPAEIGRPVCNEAVVTLEPYRALLSQFVQGDVNSDRIFVRIEKPPDRGVELGELSDGSLPDRSGGKGSRSPSTHGGAR